MDCKQDPTNGSSIYVPVLTVRFPVHLGGDYDSGRWIFVVGLRDAPDDIVVADHPMQTLDTTRLARNRSVSLPT